MEKVGKEGVITIQELDDPLILIHEKKISSINDVVKVLELALKIQMPLLNVAEDVESKALATLILNKLRAGIKVCSIKAPGFGENRKANLLDLAVLAGGQVISEELGMNLDNVEFDMLGSCKKVTISKDDTIVLDGAGEKKAIEERCEQCLTLVDYYAPLFFFKISLVQPGEFCRKVNLCEQVVLISQHLRKDSCEFCQQTVREALLKLKDPDTLEDCFYDLPYNIGYQIFVLRLRKTRDEIMKCTLSIYIDIYFD